MPFDLVICDFAFMWPSKGEHRCRKVERHLGEASVGHLCQTAQHLACGSTAAAWALAAGSCSLTVSPQRGIGSFRHCTAVNLVR